MAQVRLERAGVAGVAEAVAVRVELAAVDDTGTEVVGVGHAVSVRVARLAGFADAGVTDPVPYAAGAARS